MWQLLEGSIVPFVRQNKKNEECCLPFSLGNWKLVNWNVRHISVLHNTRNTSNIIQVTCTKSQCLYRTLEKREKKESEKEKRWREKKKGAKLLFSEAVKWLSNRGMDGGEKISAFLWSLQVFLPFTNPKDATHILFVLQKQTDCKLADNFCTDNVIYSCQPFVCHVCFIQIWTKWTSLSPLSSALKSHQFPSILSYLKFIGGQSLGWMLWRFHGAEKV